MNIMRIIAAFLIFVLMSCASALADVVATANVNLRSGPGGDYRVIGSVPKDTRMQSVGKEDADANWYHVDFNGVEGWISAKYAEIREPLIIEPIVIFPEDGATTETRIMDISAFWCANLLESAHIIGLDGYQEALGQERKGYFDGFLTISGAENVEFVGIYGGGYNVFGIRTGMDISAAANDLNKMGMELSAVENGRMIFKRPADEFSLVNIGGYDSEIALISADGLITGIEWNTLSE